METAVGINSDERQKKSKWKTHSAKLVLEEKVSNKQVGQYVGRGWNDGTSGVIEDDWGDIMIHLLNIHLENLLKLPNIG